MFKIKESKFGTEQSTDVKAKDYGTFKASFLLPGIAEASKFIEDVSLYTTIELKNEMFDALRSVSQLNVDGSVYSASKHDDVSEFNSFLDAAESDPRLWQGLIKSYSELIASEISTPAKRRKN